MKRENSYQEKLLLKRLGCEDVEHEDEVQEEMVCYMVFKNCATDHYGSYM